METFGQNNETNSVIKQSNDDMGNYEKLAQSEKMESRANAPHTIADVLKATEEFLGKDLEWDMNQSGESLQNAIPTLNNELSKLSDLLKSTAQQGSAEKVNKFLKDNGFTIELDDSAASEVDVFAASVLNMPVEWSNKGEKGKMRIYEKDSDGDDDYDNFKEIDSVEMNGIEDIYEVNGHENPIVKLETKSGDIVYMTKFNGIPPNGSTGMHTLVTNWNNQLGENTRQSVGRNGKYKGKLEFPMVDYDKSGNIDELLGASTLDKDGFPTVISEAKYQHILKMNDKGAIAKAAAAVATTRGMGGPKSIYIDGPFVVWFERDGVIPFSAYISEKDMKNPGDFDTES